MLIAGILQGTSRRLGCLELQFYKMYPLLGPVLQLCTNPSMQSAVTIIYIFGANILIWVDHSVRSGVYIIET